MANRVLRDWTASDAVEKLSPEAEVFFTRLIMKADDYGSYYANPKLLNSALFPLKEYTSNEINGFVCQCISAKLIFTYVVDGKEYLRIDNFGQRLRNMRNIFPQPADNSLTTRGEVLPDEKIDAASSGLKRNETKRNEDELTQKSFSSDFYKSASEAFEDVKNDELLIERLLRIVHQSGFRTCNEVTITLAVRKFMTIEDAKETFKTKDKQGIKEHLVNWITKHAKTLDDHAK